MSEEKFHYYNLSYDYGDGVFNKIIKKKNQFVNKNDITSAKKDEPKAALISISYMGLMTEIEYGDF